MRNDSDSLSDPWHLTAIIPVTHGSPKLQIMPVYRIYCLTQCKMYSKFIHSCPLLSARTLESLSISRKRVSDDLDTWGTQGGLQSNCQLIGPWIIYKDPSGFANQTLPSLNWFSFCIHLIALGMVPTPHLYGQSPQTLKCGKERDLWGQGKVRGYLPLWEASVISTIWRD